MRTDLLVNGAQSRLHIAGATYTDSGVTKCFYQNELLLNLIIMIGNYTCMMGRTASLRLELQIIPGE